MPSSEHPVNGGNEAEVKARKARIVTAEKCDGQLGALVLQAQANAKSRRGNGDQNRRWRV